MSSQNGHSLDRLELAILPPDDPLRQQFQAHLATLSPEDRAAWEQELALTDRLRAALTDIAPPAGLNDRLLSIPTASPQIAPPARRRFLKVDWRVAAAFILIAGLTSLFLLTREPLPAVLKPTLAHTLATYAINHRQTPLQISSADPAAVQSALAAKNLDFPVLLLKPTKGVTLQGGGTCDFGSTPAAFTQWQGNGTTYTLYQFNGKPLGIPAKFILTTDQPKELWDTQHHYQVAFFAGSDGQCCWALVMETEKAPNVFSQYGSAY